MFDISYDTKTGVITLKTGGFYQVDAIGTQMEQALALVTRARREFGRSRTLIHADELMVQSGEVVQHCAGVLDRFHANEGQERVAVIASSALVRLQLAKLFKDKHSRIFAEEGEATAWLLADDESSAAA